MMIDIRLLVIYIEFGPREVPCGLTFRVIEDS